MMFSQGGHDELDQRFKTAIEVATFLMESSTTPRTRLVELLREEMYQACLYGKLRWAVRISLVIERLQGITREDQEQEALEWLNSQRYMAAA